MTIDDDAVTGASAEAGEQAGPPVRRHSAAATDAATAAAVLDKLRAFIATLDDRERALVAALLAPGVASAFPGDEPEVVGFAHGEAGQGAQPDGTAAESGLAGWTPNRLPEQLAEQIRTQDFSIRVDPR